MKAVATWISYLLYLAVSILVVTLVLVAGMPMLERAKDVSIVTSAKNQLQKIAEATFDVSKAGPGSTTEFQFKVDEGFLFVDPEKSKVYFTKNITTGIIAPRTKVKEGYILILAGAEVESYETQDDFDCCYVMENSHIRVKFYKFNNSQRESNNVIKEIYLKDTNKTLDFSGLEILLDDNETSKVGRITTELLNTGSLLASSSLSEFVNSSESLGGVGYCYNVTYTLESKADFLEISVEGLQRC